MANTRPPIYYSDYLQLEQLLASQKPKSLEYEGKLAHDELLFIIVHQAYELWFKQILHEIDSVLRLFKADYIGEKDVAVAVARFSRVHEIQKVLIDQLQILETMTPLDFLDFRDLLTPASGFQSFQFRMIENKLGLRPGQRKLFHKSGYASRLSPEHRELVEKAETEASVFELVEAWLERTPFLTFQGFSFWENYRAAVDAMLQQDRETIKTNPILSRQDKTAELAELDKTAANFAALFDADKHKELMRKGERRLSYEATQAALLINSYRDEPILHMPFRLLTALVEMDELFTAWRYRHASMVFRMIGTKIGTGGSSGQQYLRSTAESHRVFSDLSGLATYLIPRSKLPALPEELNRNLGFYHTRSA